MGGIRRPTTTAAMTLVAAAGAVRELSGKRESSWSAWQTARVAECREAVAENFAPAARAIEIEGVWSACLVPDF